MKKLITFPFPCRPALALHEKLYWYDRAWRDGANPRIGEIGWSHTQAELMLSATLWGSETPWRADEAINEIGRVSNGQFQSPELEAYFPEALHKLWMRRAGRDYKLMSAIRYRPSAPFRILVPTLAADWNIGADVSIQEDPHRRRNSLGRRLAMSVCYEIDRRKGYPGRLTVARLFPCGMAGDEFTHPVDTFLLQIHL